MSLKSQNFFSTAFGLTPYARGDAAHIAVDVIQHANEYVIMADLPGVTKEEVSVQADGDVLMIGVEQQEIAPLVAGSRYIKQERTQNFMQRAIRLPPSADIPSLTATFLNGVLKITIPKKADAHKFIIA